MKIGGVQAAFFCLFLVFLAGGCRSEFEKVRLSNDPQKILEAAYNYYDEEEYLKAQTLFDLILAQFRGTADAEKLFFRYAYTYYHLRQYRLAAHYFNTFTTTFLYSDFKEEAQYMSAYSNYRLSPVFRLDQKETLEAIQGFQDFVDTYPQSSRVQECNLLMDQMRSKLEEKAYASAVLYHDIRQYGAAIQEFENLLKDFPETPRAERVRLYIVQSAYQWASNSVLDLRKERYELTLEKYQDFIDKFPTSQHKKELNDIRQDCREQIKILDHDEHQK